MTEHTYGESRYRILVMGLALACFASASPCQSISDAGTPPDTANAVPHSDTHIFGIIPNFRTSPTLVRYEPISPREEFRIASQDAFDRGTFALSAAFAGESQLSNGNRAFGQGIEGYSRYLGGAYAGFVIGDYMTEGVFPVILHQDPRYFRRGKGSGWSRLGYSMGQIFWTLAIRVAPSLTTPKSLATLLPWRSPTSITRTTEQLTTRYLHWQFSWASTWPPMSSKSFGRTSTAHSGQSTQSTRIL